MNPSPTNPDADAEPAAGRPGPRPRAVVLNLACFALGFVLLQAIFDRLDSPFQSAAEKMEREFATFAAHKDEYDVVFVGSSRVKNQLSPQVFDERMAAAGHPCRSFNLGYVGMYLPECSFLVDQILALHPAKLRLLVLELSNPAPRHDWREDPSVREVYWHRPGPTLLACAAVLNDPTPEFGPVERGFQFVRQGEMFARCLCHVGAGPDAVPDLSDLFRRKRRRSASPAAVQDGFVPLQTFLGAGASSATKTGGDAATLAAYLAGVETLRHEEAANAAVPSLAVRGGHWLLRRSLGDRVRGLERAGVTPVFFVGPVLTRESEFSDLRADGTLPKLLAFNDPNAHADLYDPKVRADRYHLNAAGAELLTRRLTDALSLPGVGRNSGLPAERKTQRTPE